MARGAKRSSSSIFSQDEISDFSNQEQLAGEQGKKQNEREKASSSVAEDMLTRADNALRNSFIDTHSIDQMISDPSAHQRRFSMDHRLHKICILLVVFIVVYLACVILPDNIVNAFVDPNTPSFMEVIQSNFEQLAEQLSGTAAAGFEYSPIVIMLLIALVGAGLSSIGAAYQVSFRNQLATPSSLGVMSGASVGLAVYYVISQGRAVEIAQRVAITDEQVEALTTGGQANPLTIYLGFIEGAVYAIVGAFIVVALTVIISKIAGHGKLNNAVLIIAGQVFASLANAFIVLFRLYLQSTGGQDAVSGFAMAQIGDFSGIGRALDLVFMGVPILLALIVLFLLAPQMNAIALGGDDAQTYGLRVDVVRGLIIAFSTIVTAIIVAFVGSIGFVGFAIPQIVRRFVGPNFKYLLPASALAGASFLLIVNFIYSSFTFTSTGIGVVTSVFGGVIFIISIVQQRRVPSHD